MNFQELINEIKKHRQTDKTFLIAIDGRSGSGKTTLAEKIKNNLPDSKIVNLDVFDLYQGEENIQKVITEILKPLRENLDEEKVVIIEGVFAFNPELESYYDYKIWVECTEEVGYRRGLRRDIKSNGVDNSEEWNNFWIPKEREYIRENQPQKKADFIVDFPVE